VLVTAFSFLASASPILRAGARPRFVDIDPQSFMMNLDDVERHIGPATKAIVAVHMYGQSLPMDRLEAIANRHGIALIEDAAQGLGTQYRGRPVGSMGRVSCLSFDPTKVIGSFSSGGAVVTDDPEIARKIAMQRYHGRDPATREYELLGFNSQLSTEMAAMLLFKLSKMREWEAERHAVANIYQKGLADLTQQISLPVRADGSSHNWHKFVIRAADRDGLMAHLKNKGVQTLIHYPTAICDTPLFAAYSGESNVPEARHAIRTVLSLPIFAELNELEAQTVVQRIREYYHQ
jgi:dTDP-4-amino-4,6-dideoxygalactose transaminase